MITFKTIKWKNFLSTGDHWNEINFLEQNTNLIIGTNGSGKSTMLDALTFALFNKPFRKINKSQLMNSVNERDSLVEYVKSDKSVQKTLFDAINKFSLDVISLDSASPNIEFSMTKLNLS